MINIKLIFKAVALTNFLLLIAIFLWSNQTAANREVRPNSEPIFTSPNGGTPAKTTTDTSSKKHYQLKRLLFSSSKSLVITDNFKLKGDTVMDRKDSTVTKKNSKRFRPTSKFGITFDQKIMFDSLGFDKKRQRPKKLK